MKTGFLISGAAVAALVAGGASATIHKSHHKMHMGAVATYAAPSQPIPYAQLDSYLAAKPSQRASVADSAASMGSSPAPQMPDTGAARPSSPGAEPSPPAGDQMGNSGMSASGAMPADPGMTGKSPPDNAPPPPPSTDQGSPPDGASTPPK